jgi:hypothetical protein
MPRYVLLAMTNAVEGRDDEFNEWYSKRHLLDVLKVPGIIAAQRFELTPQQRYQPPYPFKYIALYEIETDDLDSVISFMNAHVGTDTIPVSDAMSAMPPARGLYFQPITERLAK